MGREPEGGGQRVTEQLVVLELIAAVFCFMISGSVLLIAHYVKEIYRCVNSN
jgi:hypothetical protein